jgi:microcystin-dependent protein
MPGFRRKSSQPRKTQLLTTLPKPPEDAPEWMRTWFDSLKGAIDEDRETIEAALVEIRNSIPEEVESTSETEEAAVVSDAIATAETHSNENDPTAKEKEALAGTHGTPSKLNKYVTNTDPRLNPPSSNGNFSPGMLMPYAGATAPDGWLICDGSEVDKFSNANLYGVIADTWGVPSTSDVFKLPDLRGRTLIGAGTGTGLTARTLGDLVGVEQVTLTANQSGLPLHDHTIVTNPTDSGDLTVTGSPGVGTETDLQTEETGGDAAIEAHTNMQPSAAINWIIKV